MTERHKLKPFNSGILKIRERISVSRRPLYSVQSLDYVSSPPRHSHSCTQATQPLLHSSHTATTALKSHSHSCTQATQPLLHSSHTATTALKPHSHSCTADHSRPEHAKHRQRQTKEETEKERKCLPPLQVSLQPCTHVLPARKIKT